MPYIAASEALRAAAGYAVRQVTAAVQEAGMGPGVHVECVTVPGCVQLVVLVEGQGTAAEATEGGGRGGGIASSWLQPRALWAAVARAAEGLGMRPLTMPRVQCVAAGMDAAGQQQQQQQQEQEQEQQEPQGQEEVPFALEPETSARAPTLVYIEPPVIPIGVLVQPRREGRERPDTGTSGGAGGTGGRGGGLRVRLGGGTAAAELEEAGACPASGIAVELFLPPDCLQALGGHDHGQQERQEQHGEELPAATATGPAAELQGGRRWRLAVTAAVQDIAGRERGPQGAQLALPPVARASPARLLALCNAPPPGLPLRLLLPPILLHRPQERPAVEVEVSAREEATSPSTGLRGGLSHSLSALLQLHLLAVPRDASVPPPPPPPPTPAAQTAIQDNPAVLSPFHTPLLGAGTEYLGNEPAEAAASPRAGAAFAGSAGSIGMEEGQAADVGTHGADADVPQAVWLGSAPLLLAPPGPAGELAALWERMRGAVRGAEQREQEGKGPTRSGAEAAAERGHRRPDVTSAPGRYLATSGLAMQHHMRPLLRDLAAAVGQQGQGQGAEGTAHLRAFLQSQGMAGCVEWMDEARGREGVPGGGSNDETPSTSSNLATSSSGSALPTISSSTVSSSAARSSLGSDSGCTNPAQSGGGGAAAAGGAGGVAGVASSVGEGSASPLVGAGGHAGGGVESRGTTLPRGVPWEVAQPSTGGLRPGVHRGSSF